MQKREFDLIGGCTLRPCLAYKLSKNGPRHLVINSLPYTATGAAVQPVDMVDNFFIARASKLRDILWDENLKVGEHEDFFLRAANKLTIGYYPRLFMQNDRSCRDGNSWNQRLSLYHRSRIFNFWKLAWNKHGLVRMSTNYSNYALHVPVVVDRLTLQHFKPNGPLLHQRPS